MGALAHTNRWAHAQKSRAWAPRAPLLPHFAPYPHFVDVEDLYILCMYKCLGWTLSALVRTGHTICTLCACRGSSLYANRCSRILCPLNRISSPYVSFVINNLYFNVVTRTDSSMFYSYSVLFKQRAKWDLGQQQVLSRTVLSSAKPSGSTWW